MSTKKTGITAFSLLPETEKVLNRLQNKLHKNRSELIREMINYYAKSAKKTPDKSMGVTDTRIDGSDTNKILKYYFQLISRQKYRPSMVIGIAIINKKNKVLIGSRKSRDVYVKNLTWTFPTGKFSSLDFESEIAKTVKQETGLNVKILQLAHARLIPDSPEKKIRIIALYYHCRIVSGKARAGGDFKEIKWIPASEVTRHFTTSVSDEIMNFLGKL
jgi:ADP-ribose pyrophosphatase YjhB (NUDIX family)